MTRALAFAALLLLLAAAKPAEAAIVHSGTATSVYDGDTLTLRNASNGATVKVRFHGLDAPELAQTCLTAAGISYACGRMARANLTAQIGTASLACEQKDKDRYGRVVGVCRRGTLDLNDWMVRRGQALAYRTYSLDYVAAEDEARLARRGMWSGTFVQPWVWRKLSPPPSPPKPPPRPPPRPRPPPPKPRPPPRPRPPPPTARPSPQPPIVRPPAPRPPPPVVQPPPPRPPPPVVRPPPPLPPSPPPPAPPPPACLIKGNISSSGKIYHVPGGRYYDSTEIDESKGERWFCTEAEAVAAGWRKAAA